MLLPKGVRFSEKLQNYSVMKFDRSNKFDLCYNRQVNSLRLKSSVASKWASNTYGGNIIFAGYGAINHSFVQLCGQWKTLNGDVFSIFSCNVSHNCASHSQESWTWCDYNFFGKKINWLFLFVWSSQSQNFSVSPFVRACTPPPLCNSPPSCKLSLLIKWHHFRLMHIRCP